MTDRPIIFSAPMVRALLAGRKTQTRRILRAEVPAAPPMDAISANGTARHPAPYLDAYCGQPMTRANPRGMSDRWCWWTRDDRPGPTFRVPHVPGDRLWVRENHAIVPWTAYRASDGVQQTRSPEDSDDAAIYAAGWERSKPRWRPSIHMPRWASRLTLVVTKVRVERLQDISEDDAADEGVILTDLNWPTYRTNFAELWRSIHGPDAWAANPWVAAISFSVHRANIDALAMERAA